MVTRVVNFFGQMHGNLSFRNKIFIFILLSMGLQITFIGINFRSALLDTLEHQVGMRALVQAQEIASDPLLIGEVLQNDVAEVDKIISRLFKNSDASFIVVGDKQGIRLSHPVKERIGQPMKGLDNAGALERGESYISFSEGSLGYSVRGKTPLLDEGGNIVGVVSVGYLIDRFDQWLIAYAKPLLADFIVILLITLSVGWWFSTLIKRNMNGMEPAEIALAFQMQKSILKSVYEGVIALDKQGKVITVNNTALELMGANIPAREMKQRNLSEFVKETQFFFRTPYDENLKDELVTINGEVMVANRVAIFDQNVLVGWVVSFRSKQEMVSLTEELRQTKQYTDSLRAMRDEHNTKLSTIAGLIEMGYSGAALSLIHNEEYRNQATTDFISERIECKQIAGVLIGKAAKARGQGLELVFDEACTLGDNAGKLSAGELAAIVGNLIDNAYDATHKNPDSNKAVHLLITDAGDELVLEIKDNGCGIDPGLATTMFSRGVSSKEGDEDGTGVGLYLINRYVQKAGGVIMVDENPPKGTVFSIFLPKSTAD